MDVSAETPGQAPELRSNSRRIGPVGFTGAGRATETAAVGLPVSFSVGGAHLQPDRLGIWPVEGGAFGLDITYTGPDGYARAEAVERALKAHRVPCGFRQELADGWTLRLGPVDKETMLVTLGAVVT